MKALDNTLNRNLIASLGRLWEILKTTSLIATAVAVAWLWGNYINCDCQMTVWTIANSLQSISVPVHCNILAIVRRGSCLLVCEPYERNY